MNSFENDLDSSFMPSIFDINYEKLISMDINKVREMFLNEINTLEKADSWEKKKFLDKFFENIFFDKGSIFLEYRFLIDLISTPGLSDILYFRDALNDFESDDKSINGRKNLLIKIFNYYDNHSKEECEKFNYVFRSGSVIGTLFKNRDLSVEKYFSSRIMNWFDKETLSQFYREYLSFDGFNELLSEERYKTLYMISIIAMKLKNEVGHNVEFIDRFLILSNRKQIYEVFDGLYDQYVGDSSFEGEFRERFVNDNSFLYINELVRLILNNRIKEYEDLSKDSILESFYRRHYGVFKIDTLSKIKDKTFDINNDFKNIKNHFDLSDFIETLLLNIYGISYDEAQNLCLRYALYEKELSTLVKDYDKEILSILKAINNIVNLSLGDREKIRALQLLYYDKVSKYGLESDNNFYSYFALESLFNRMIINTYNGKLLKANNLEVIDVKDGVTILDAGLNFNIILTAVNGVGNLYSDKVSMLSRWNTSSLSNTHGLCCSYINNESLGVISFKGVFLGFDNIYQYGLNKMEATDMYSHGSRIDLRVDGVAQNDKRIFYPVGVLADETRYGYNELLLDRFLMEDKDNCLKMQPSYVVYYKFDDNYEDSVVFKQSLKTARDFNIPIVVVDVLKIKENEKREILLMEEALFSSNKCNSELLKKIITRYMNNYTGSLTMVGSENVNYKEDFSIKGMESFFNILFFKISSIEDRVLKDEWINSLLEVYNVEDRKCQDAMDAKEYAHSIRTSILYDGYRISSRINLLKGNGGIFLDYDSFTYDTESIINLVNYLGEDSTIKVVKKDAGGYWLDYNSSIDSERRLIQELVVAYFLDSDSMCIDNMLNSSYFDASVNDDVEFVERINNSYVYPKLFKDVYGDTVPKFDLNKLNSILEKIESISNEEFLAIFFNTILNVADRKRKRFEEVSCDLLDKKANIRREFNKLQGQKYDIKASMK